MDVLFSVEENDFLLDGIPLNAVREEAFRSRSEERFFVKGKAFLTKGILNYLNLFDKGLYNVIVTEGCTYVTLRGDELEIGSLPKVKLVTMDKKDFYVDKENEKFKSTIQEDKGLHIQCIDSWFVMVLSGSLCAAVQELLLESGSMK